MARVAPGVAPSGDLLPAAGGFEGFGRAQSQAELVAL